MERKDLKSLRPFEELIAELFQKGQAEQRALDEETKALGRWQGDSKKLAIAEMLQQAGDPLAMAVEHALYSFADEAQISLRLLCQAKITGRAQAEVVGWVSQLKDQLKTTNDADRRLLLQVAIENLQEQLQAKDPVKS